MSALDAWKTRGAGYWRRGQRSAAQPVAGPRHLLVSWIWQSKVGASLWSPPPARGAWPLRPLAAGGAPASGAASGTAGSSPAGGPGLGGASLPPPSVYNEKVDSAGSVREGWDGWMTAGSHTARPDPRFGRRQARCPHPSLRAPGSGLQAGRAVHGPLPAQGTLPKPAPDSGSHGQGQDGISTTTEEGTSCEWRPTQEAGQKGQCEPRGGE